MEKGIIFDLDGTLLDTIEDLSEAGNRVLESHGFPKHSVDNFKEMVGSGIHRLVERMLPVGSRSEERVHLMVKQMEEVYHDCWKTHTKPFGQIPELLDQLKNRCFRLAVLSNKPESFTVEMTRDLLPNHTFKPVWGATPRRPKKPDPTAALEIARCWDIPVSEIMMVGDSEADVQTAKRSGMISVAVTWGFRSQQQLEKELPDFLLHTPADLLSLL